MEARTDKTTETPPSASKAAPTPNRRRLHRAVLRLAAVALLFTGWMGYLVYLVVTMPHTSRGEPLILSRSQLLVSELDVIAQVDSDGAATEVTIKEVLYPVTDAPVQVGQKLHVKNLWECRPLAPLPQSPGEKPIETPLDWNGPGLYLLPLQKVKVDETTYEVAPTPPSPGYPHSGSVGPPRIYPGNDAAKAQYRTIKKP